MCDSTLQHVLCRFPDSDLFLRADVLSRTQTEITVKNPTTGDVTSFSSSKAGDLQFAANSVDVVYDVVPTGKLVNIGCPVLVPAGYENDVDDGCFTQCYIVDKLYKPLRAKVRYSNGTTAWIDKESLRVMQSPWIYWDSGDSTDVSVNKLLELLQSKKTKRAAKLKKPAYKKGEIVRLPHGVLKKVKLNRGMMQLLYTDYQLFCFSIMESSGVGSAFSRDA